MNIGGVRGEDEREEGVGGILILLYSFWVEGWVVGWVLMVFDLVRAPPIQEVTLLRRSK